MCGIVGYIGSKQAAPIILDGLSKLEYRGYDSAGIAVYDGSKIVTRKAIGRLKVLENLTKGGETMPGQAGIGHTRWATHGAPSDRNAHPHTNAGGTIAVVHNGIIENYIPLKKMLTEKGYQFASETDTEVLAHLMDYYYKGNPLEAVTKVLHRVEGSYALGILFADYPDEIYAARKDSPLIVGQNADGCFIASDVPAILKYTRNVYYMDNQEVVILQKSGLQFFSVDEEEVFKEPVTIDWDADAAEKAGYEHFMLKEINEQPAAVRNTLSPRVKNGLPCFEECGLTDEMLAAYKHIFIIGCGSAMHAGMVGKYVIEELSRSPVIVDIASEFRYRDPLISKDDLCVIISQSGETADTKAALTLANEIGADTLAVVNVVGSSIAREAKMVMYTNAGPEISVCSTKAYAVQTAFMYLLAFRVALARGAISEDRCRELTSELMCVPQLIEKCIESKEQYQYVASKLINAQSLMYIGRGLDYALSMEGSLKLKEISYIHSEAYAAGELKHGTISLIEDGTLVVAAATYAKLFEKAISNVVEVKSRGADVLALTTAGHVEEMGRVANGLIAIPDTDELLLPSLGVAPLQLLAYYIALMRGCDIDKPRNLAKSVTVE